MLTGPVLSLVSLTCLFGWLVSPASAGDIDTLSCHPRASKDQIIADSDALRRIGRNLHASNHAFAWPDTPIGVVKVGGKYSFFASDGVFRTNYNGHVISGSATKTEGTLENPVSGGIVAEANIAPTPYVLKHGAFKRYDYLGGGPVYRVGDGSIYSGALIMVTHAEIKTPEAKPRPGFYSSLGLAVSTNNGASWKYLGEVIRPNKPYSRDGAAYDIGDPPLTVTPDKKFFRIYFQDWLASGANEEAITHLSVAQAPVQAVLQAAFGPNPHAATFYKYYQSGWTELGLGGRSTDIDPNVRGGSERQVFFNTALDEYILIVGGGPIITFAESKDGLNWSKYVPIKNFVKSNFRNYIDAVGLGSNPSLLGNSFDVIYTAYPNNGLGWKGAQVRKFTVYCK